MPIYEYTCNDCGETSSIFFRSLNSAEKGSSECENCGSSSMKRLISNLGRIQSKGDTSSGELRAVDPRKTIESMNRQYDNAGIDPGKGFEEVARQSAAGKDPETLKEVINEARKNEPTKSSSSSKKEKRKKGS